MSTSHISDKFMAQCVESRTSPDTKKFKTRYQDVYIPKPINEESNDCNDYVSVLKKLSKSLDPKLADRVDIPDHRIISDVQFQRRWASLIELFPHNGILENPEKKIPIIEELNILLYSTLSHVHVREYLHVVFNRIGVCSIPWGPNPIAFRCVDCVRDPYYIAQCAECFFKSNHSGHSFKVIHTHGGHCGCGKPSALDPKGFCSDHAGVTASQDSSQCLSTLPQCIQTRAPQIIDMVVEYILKIDYAGVDDVRRLSDVLLPVYLLKWLQDISLAAFPFLYLTATSMSRDSRLKSLVQNHTSLPLLERNMLLEIYFTLCVSPTFKRELSLEFGLNYLNVIGVDQQHLDSLSEEEHIVEDDTATASNKMKLPILTESSESPEDFTTLCMKCITKMLTIDGNSVFHVTHINSDGVGGIGLDESKFVDPCKESEETVGGRKKRGGTKLTFGIQFEHSLSNLLMQIFSDSKTALEMIKDFQIHKRICDNICAGVPPCAHISDFKYLLEHRTVADHFIENPESFEPILQALAYQHRIGLHKRQGDEHVTSEDIRVEKMFLNALIPMVINILFAFVTGLDAQICETVAGW